MNDAIENLKDPKFEKFLTSVDEELGRDPESLTLFEWAVEDYYDSELKDNQEYFKGRPDLLHINNETILFQLDEMLDYFLIKEEYEKCAKLLEVKEYISKEVKRIAA